MEFDTSELNKLFFEKKYQELISLIEKNIQDKSSKILNLLGVSRMLNNKNKDSFILAISEFKEAYLKEETSKIGLESLINFLNAITEFYKYLNIKEKNFSFEHYFNDALNFYNKAENFFGYNSDLLLGVIDIYKILNDVEKVVFYLDVLNKKQDLNISASCSWILYNNYLSKWLQKDYFENSTLLDLKIKKYPEEKLIKIKKNNNSKKKIGFMSADILKQHSVTYFLKTILLNYDKDKYEIFLFFNHSQLFDDKTTEEFKLLVSEYFYINFLDDKESINFIRKLNLDIIFDLMGVSSKNRMSLFKNRVAPIQISWLGYCNTTGLNEMDYLIADRNLILPEEEKFYSEKILYMPNIWSCHVGFSIKPNTHIPPCQKNNFITFGSFNNFNKINDDVLHVWLNILKNVSKSKLILKSSVNIETNRIKNFFKENFKTDSLIFLDKEKNFNDHLNLYNQIDIALDTFPYNGVTTSFEAIWMGVPVVTTKGFNFNSRCGESINKNLGLNEFITNNYKNYIDFTINLAKDIDQITQVKKKIENHKISSPLFDTNLFSKNFFNILDSLL